MASEKIEEVREDFLTKVQWIFLKKFQDFPKAYITTLFLPEPRRTKQFEELTKLCSLENSIICPYELRDTLAECKHYSSLSEQEKRIVAAIMDSLERGKELTVSELLEAVLIFIGKRRLDMAKRLAQYLCGPIGAEIQAILSVKSWSI